MKKILEYVLTTKDLLHNNVYEIEMPRAAKILNIDFRGCVPVIDAIVNPDKEKRKYTFHIFATGYEMTDYDKKHYEYIKTIRQKRALNQDLFWHIFLVHE